MKAPGAEGVTNARSGEVVGAAARTRRARPVKVLQLCAVDFTVFHFLLPLARRLRERFEVHFASSTGPYTAQVRDEGFAYHDVPVERSYNMVAHTKALVALRRLMRHEAYDVVHTHTPIAALIGRIAARSAGVPLTLYTAHGFYFHDRMPWHRRQVFVGLERVGGWFTDFTFTQSDEDRESAIRLGVCPPDRIQHIGNGIDLVRFDPDRLQGARAAVRAELGVPADAHIVCVVGRLVREKGYPELIEAFARVAADVPSAWLLAVGGALDSDRDDAAAEISGAVARAGLAGRVRFLSFRRDVERILSASDVFVLPSHREGMPRSVIEAMAMGLPVVVTDIRGSREAVTAGVNGLVVPVADAGSLARALIDLLEDGEMRRRFGDAARRAAVERFDEKHVVGAQVETIERLLAARGIGNG